MSGSDDCSEKRQVPPAISRFLEWDRNVTQAFCESFSRRYPSLSVKSQAKFMEVSCTGYVWLPGIIIALILPGSWIPHHVVINLLNVLFIDVAIVSCLKAFARRRRPETKKADFFTSVGADKFSFPSGHACRSVLIASVFTRVYPLFNNCILSLISACLFWFWSIAVCLSRVVNGRHYLFDVLAGATLGFVESCFLTTIWLSPEQAATFLKWFTDETSLVDL